MTLTEKNYYGKKATQEFFSVSQFKDFMKCEACALAKIQGEYKEDFSEALLAGSYVDEHLTGTPDSMKKFIMENYDKLYKKNGEPYAFITKADEAIEHIKKQPLMLKYLTGKHQKIMTGEIAGVPFKIKMDCYREGEFISDLKYMASLRSPNMFEPMIKYWGYDIQAAVYQEIVYQNTGKRLPFLFVIATKEKPCHLAVGEISQFNMDEALDVVKANAPRFYQVKKGEIEPERCEDYNCDYCTTTKIITQAIDTDWLGMSTKQIKGMRGVI